MKMSPEHADLEADWLADELKRLYDNAHLAYNALPDGPDASKARLYLAYIIKGSESLYTHYRANEGQWVEEAPEQEEASRPRHRRRGRFARFFLGD